MALGAHEKVANDAKIIKYKALISTLTAAKSAWLADPVTTARDVQTFNTGPEGNFAMIAPYIRVNGAQPTDEQHLLSLSEMPNSVRIDLGTVDDSSFGGQNSDQSPKVTLITQFWTQHRSADHAGCGKKSVRQRRVGWAEEQ